MLPWSDDFERVLRAHLPQLEPDWPLAPDQVLADVGLDSLESVSLLLDLEDAFGTSFSDEVLATGRFDTPESTWQLLQAARTGG